MIVSIPSVSIEECELIIQSAKRWSKRIISIPRVENIVKPPKRKLGRPRKYPIKQRPDEPIFVSHVENVARSSKRTRGRPRKHPVKQFSDEENIAEIPKRKRGRPRKQTMNTANVETRSGYIFTAGTTDSRTIRQPRHSLLSRVEWVKPGEPTKTVKGLRGRPRKTPLAQQTIPFIESVGATPHPGGDIFENLSRSYEQMERLVSLDEQIKDQSLSEEPSISLVEDADDCSV
ncbi:hypothetical protein XU18_3811 [Perkinsela sp. CCAP 1560/4]|nr:hypothetical protein XU18_3811 [Perkinsela sp. CCAP 1560/4]|eukprot:KNH05083.1 hypothetical protein XU18_3811 [Perkinsela sp. CCAP 1560/4]